MATALVKVYQNFLLKALNKEIKWAAASPDTMKCTLHTVTYSPNMNTDAYQAALTNEVASGNGYTTGGNTLTSVSAALVAANSLTAWAADTLYQIGNVRKPVSGNGHVYIVVAVAGDQKSAPVTEPTWPTTAGGTVVDDQVTWAEAGAAVLKLTGTIPSWTSATFTTRYGVVADTTPGSAATNPLVALLDFQADQSPSNGTFAITLDGDGLVVIPIRS